MKMILSENEILDAVREHFELGPEQSIQLLVTRSRKAARPAFTAEVTDPEPTDLDRALAPRRKPRKPAVAPAVDETPTAPEA